MVNSFLFRPLVSDLTENESKILDNAYKAVGHASFSEIFLMAFEQTRQYSVNIVNYNPLPSPLYRAYNLRNKCRSFPLSELENNNNLVSKQSRPKKLDLHDIEYKPVTKKIDYTCIWDVGTRNKKGIRALTIIQIAYRTIYKKCHS